MLSKRDQEILQRFFEKSQYCQYEDLAKLAQKTGLPKIKISNWFKYQRRLFAEADSNNAQKKLIEFMEPGRTFTENPTSKEEKSDVDVLPRAKVHIIGSVRAELVRAFESNPYCRKADLTELIMKTGLGKQQIDNWFAYKRNPKVKGQKRVRVSQKVSHSSGKIYVANITTKRIQIVKVEEFNDSIHWKLGNFEEGADQFGLEIEEKRKHDGIGCFNCKECSRRFYQGIPMFHYRNEEISELFEFKQLDGVWEVFAKRVIPRSLYFGPLLGKIEDPLDDLQKSNYLGTISRQSEQVYIYTNGKEESNWLRYVRSSNDRDESNLIIFRLLNGFYFYYVCKPIEKEEEAIVHFDVKASEETTRKDSSCVEEFDIEKENDLIEIRPEIKEIIMDEDECKFIEMDAEEEESTSKPKFSCERETEEEDMFPSGDQYKDPYILLKNESGTDCFVNAAVNIIHNCIELRQQVLLSPCQEGTIKELRLIFERKIDKSTALRQSLPTLNQRDEKGKLKQEDSMECIVKIFEAMQDQAFDMSSVERIFETRRRCHVNGCHFEQEQRTQSTELQKSLPILKSATLEELFEMDSNQRRDAHHVCTGRQDQQGRQSFEEEEVTLIIGTHLIVNVQKCAAWFSTFKIMDSVIIYGIEWDLVSFVQYEGNGSEGHYGSWTRTSDADWAHVSDADLELKRRARMDLRDKYTPILLFRRRDLG